MWMVYINFLFSPVAVSWIWICSWIWMNVDGSAWNSTLIHIAADVTTTPPPAWVERCWQHVWRRFCSSRAAPPHCCWCWRAARTASSTTRSHATTVRTGAGVWRSHSRREKRALMQCSLARYEIWWKINTVHAPRPVHTTSYYKKVAHTRLPSVGFRSWSRFLAVSLQVTCVINPAVGCHYLIAAKLVTALLRVSGVTAGLAESNGSLPSGLWLTSPAGWLPRTGISSGTAETLRSVVEYGLFVWGGMYWP